MHSHSRSVPIRQLARIAFEFNKTHNNPFVSLQCKLRWFLPCEGRWLCRLDRFLPWGCRTGSRSRHSAPSAQRRVLVSHLALVDLPQRLGDILALVEFGEDSSGAPCRCCFDRGRGKRRGRRGRRGATVATRRFVFGVGDTLCGVREWIEWWGQSMEGVPWCSKQVPWCGIP